MTCRCNTCVTLVGDVVNGGGYACVGAGGIWEISVPFQLFCEPKTAPNNKVYLKKKIDGCGTKEVVADLRRAVSVRC